jgi:hypothetical protein
MFVGESTQSIRSHNSPTPKIFQVDIFRDPTEKNFGGVPNRKAQKNFEGIPNDTPKKNLGHGYMCERGTHFLEVNMEKGSGDDDLWGWGWDALTQRPHLRNEQGGREGSG